MKLPWLAKTFLTHRTSEAERELAAVASSISEGLPRSPTTQRKRARTAESTTTSNATPHDTLGSAKRNEAQAQKRRDLDDFSCIIQKTDNPEICHVFPFSANAKEDDRARLEKPCEDLSPLLGIGRRSKFPGDLVEDSFASRVGVSDKKWNMVSMSRTLHDWWARAYFALKGLGTTTMPSEAPKPEDLMTLRLQFHWMVRRRRPCGAKPKEPLARSKEEFLAAFDGCYGDPTLDIPLVAADRPASGWVIRTGDIFYVKIQSKHVAKMICAFELQWALCRMIAIAGGPEALDDIPDDPEFLNENFRFASVEEGLQEALKDMFP